MTSVFLADDHPAFRMGIRQYFDRRDDCQVVGETGDGSVCLKQLELLCPDWAIIDLAMPGLTGFEILDALARQPDQATRTIILSMHADMPFAERARELGASGFLAKEDAVSVLDFALATPEGGFFMSESVGRPAAAILSRPQADDIAALTVGERRVLALLADGKTSKEIARDIDVSPRTVQSHRHNIGQKLGLHGPNRLLEFAVRNRERLRED